MVTISWHRLDLEIRRHLRRLVAGRAWLAALCVAAVSGMAFGQTNEADPTGDGDASTEEAVKMVSLNLPQELSVKVLVDFVSKREGINFIYERNLLNQSVHLEAPNEIPASAMRTLMESVLKMKGLAIAETDVPGLLRIERTRQLQLGDNAGGEDGVGEARPLEATTRLFELEHADASRIQQLVTPLLTTPAASLVILEELGTVMVTDYATNMPKIERMVALLDRPGRQAEIEFVEAENLEAQSLVNKVNQLIAARRKVNRAGRGADGLTVMPDERTNKVIVVGERDEVDEAMSLLDMLDVPLGLETRIHRFEVVDPARIDELVQAVIGDLAVGRLYQAVTDDEANLLIANATPEIHERIVALKEQFDVPDLEAQSPIRFYKLEHARATDVLSLLQSIEGGSGISGVTVDGVSAEAEGAEGADAGASGGETREDDVAGPTEAAANRESGDGEALGGLDRRSRSVELPDARVLADEATNTVIVIAAPSAQRVYERLIERLDIRRPQVLVEATVVVLDTSDEFSLGVEIFSGEEANSGQLLNFTQFGLSTSTSQPGSVTLNPGTGFTGALLDANVAEVVIRALESDQRARVVSRPSVLINDNATGSLVSEQEEPFETVSVSDTSVERTSFGGFASAGTNIEITPQISEGDHLNLEYSITLSSFSQEGSAASTLPPARQTNTLSSVATIPDGHTIVVGGLTRESFSNNIDRVPLLGSIPVLEYLFSSRGETRTQDTLFVFLHAVILRDDKFEDLKILSNEAAARADIAGDFPESEPVEIR